MRRPTIRIGRRERHIIIGVTVTVSTVLVLVQPALANHAAIANLIANIVWLWEL